MRLIKNNLRSRSGFTMIEILISFVIFGLMMGVISSSFVTISRTYRYGYLLVNAQKNLRFVLESMTREIKEGSQYYKNPGSLYFSFIDKDGNQVEYYVDTEGDLIRKQAAEELPVIALDLKVSDAIIDVRCTAPSSGCQPRVTFIFTIQPRAGQIDFKTILQTTIVQRQVGMY
ncbi:MAG: hypothetical protein UX61_C0006G0010 [Parcubacteria group bacterium GW2011_GWA2_46_7]|nr:MAG: hypothetical protein UX14_C0032G0006 [Parcubacteria group bacterium GW2011_GWF1_45_5]KKU44042.1 MAG: hypothetical protein UX61_C0006G0010 [Parcubacteria group bacterium GW2011_GWA2_46_7]KKU47102.1 MAG: hypothetical protein UX66_C0025G0011 [Parcubacteria group bacterium GW2011_GWF2_46_8]